MIFITEDRAHDSAAVFTEKSVKELQEKFETERFIEFTDCFAGQYRGKTAFVDLSFLSNDVTLKLNAISSKQV